LQFAVALARLLDAALTGVGVQAFSPYIASTGAFGYVDAGAIQAIRDEIDREIAEAKALFEGTASGQGVRAEWRQAVDDPVDVLSRLSRSADIVIATHRSPSEGSAATAEPGDLLVSSGRPVLVVPPEPQPLAMGKALLAWKDGREARRALSSTLPFLQQLKSVVVCEISRPDSLEDAEVRTSEIAGYLKMHGVEATALATPVGHGRVSAQLVDIARSEGADLIVAGAYAHPRIREWVFGGVTQDLLDGSPLPCLLSH
jgi:nucleotide-binding universal stress UspA family protein